MVEGDAGADGADDGLEGVLDPLGNVGRGGGGKYSAATSRRSANVSDQTLPFLAATGSLSATPSAAASRASRCCMPREIVYPVTILRLAYLKVRRQLLTERLPLLTDR